MDERTEKARDTVLTDELMRNERTVTHPTYGEITLHRPTPRMDFAISEVRGRQYQKDLMDENILSQAELEKLAVRRGIWTKEDSERSLRLQAQIGQIMALLEHVGYKSIDALVLDFNKTLADLSESFSAHEEREAIDEAIYRYFDLDNTAQDKADYSKVFKAAPNSSTEEYLDKARTLRAEIKLMEQLQEAKRELEPLLIESNRLFKDSIEERAKRAEAMAKLYHCVTRDGKPLWDKFDKILDEKPRDIEMLMEEMFFFEQGIPDRERNILGRHGFTLRAPIENSSDDSQGSPLPNSDGESQPNEPISSGKPSESTV